jgi:hypothetical protein
MPAHRMAALVCRSTVRVRLWIGADSTRLLTCVPGKSARPCHHCTIRGDRWLQRNESCQEPKSGCETCCRWRLSAARHDHDVRCPAYRRLVVGVRLENGTRSRRFLNVSCVWRRRSHNHGAQRCTIALERAYCVLRDETSRCSIDKPVLADMAKTGQPHVVRRTACLEAICP